MSENKLHTKKLSVREICFIAIFTAIIAVCAQIAIPMPGGVPFTLQTWAISLAGVLLGAKHGVIAVLAYILLGAVGVPVFANFQGGLGIILGRTGGFILSFPLLVLIVGLGAKRQRLIWLIAALLIGTVVNLFTGMVYFSFVMGVNLPTAFVLAVRPFLLPETLRIIFVTIVCPRIKRALDK